MRAPISVIVPTLNAEMALAACLTSLFEGVQAGIIRELIVVDGGSSDRTVELAQEAGAKVLQTASSRGGQLQQGCAAAAGDWLLILHADSELADGWSDAATNHLARGGAGWFKLRFDDGSAMARMVAGWANLRARLLKMPFGDQGLLVSRELYERVGGFADIPLMEDVALSRALGQHLRPIGATIITSADRYRAQGWVRRGARNLWTQLRFFCGASPDKLARDYSGQR